MMRVIGRTITVATRRPAVGDKTKQAPQRSSRGALFCGTARHEATSFTAS
jgi:hypothetical protein